MTHLKKLNKLWAGHSSSWRNPLDVLNQLPVSTHISSELLRYKVKGAWWDILQKLKIRLLISREYEHFLLSLGAGKSEEISYLPLAHPSGVAINRKENLVYVASTRNPNQVYTFSPIEGMMNRDDLKKIKSDVAPQINCLMPMATSFYPGCLYMHDLAFIDGQLYANAVAHNAIVRLDLNKSFTYVWWPKSVEGPFGPKTEANYLQLNSIAAGSTIEDSYFSASTPTISKYRPGDINFEVDKVGVIFSGRTKEIVCDGLTRPHSTRLYQDKIWIDNSGYGEFGFVDHGQLQVVTKLPGWTRGLAIHENIAFVGTSRVIPKFHRYAPGLDVKKSVCGIFALDIDSGNVLGSIEWPMGNQIFSIEWINADITSGFPMLYKPKKSEKHLDHLFYAFKNTK